MTNYRKIWEEKYGKIPKDAQGRTFEIHHIDGNHNNNNIENLICVSIQEHYDIHYKRGDYGSCVMIAKRMSLPPEYLSEIQKGIKRPGVGGVKKGTIPWNKGVKGYKLNLSEESRNSMRMSSKKNAKIKDAQILKIVERFLSNEKILNQKIGKIQKNGKLFTYKRAFCEKVSKEYNVTIQAIERILKLNVQEK